MKKVGLNEVFGVMRDIPQYTYVDRQQLDEKFSYLLDSQRHIVVYGASKQGKSCLRRKTIAPEATLEVQCLQNMDSEETVWRTALEKAGVEVVLDTATKTGSSDTLAADAAATLQLPFVAKAETEVQGSTTENSERVASHAHITGDSHLMLLAEYLTEHNLRLVLEDFHYLPDEVRKSTAFGLKALYEMGAYVVIIGVWSEQNLLTYYNGDLTGRIEEVNLVWSAEELSEVLSKGEGALNVSFAPGLRQQLIESTYNNVGLLQRLAEKICFTANVLQTADTEITLSDRALLQDAQMSVVNDLGQRYTRISEVFKESMRSDSKLLIYARIYNELVRSSDDELINGISYTDLLRRMQDNSTREIRTSDLTSALDRIERLQAKRGVTPLLVSYSKSLKKLFLNDREFLFYRKFSGVGTEHLLIDTEETAE